MSDGGGGNWPNNNNNNNHHRQQRALVRLFFFLVFLVLFFLLGASNNARFLLCSSFARERREIEKISLGTRGPEREMDARASLSFSLFFSLARRALCFRSRGFVCCLNVFVRAN